MNNPTKDCLMCGKYVCDCKTDTRPKELNQKEPNFTQKVSSFASSLIKHVQGGFSKVDHVTVAIRMDICRACEHYDSTNTSCNKCGCFLNTKTSWGSESCPLGKWKSTTSKKKCGECSKKKT